MRIKTTALHEATLMRRGMKVGRRGFREEGTGGPPDRAPNYRLGAVSRLRSLIRIGLVFASAGIPTHVHAPPLYPRSRTARQGGAAGLDSGRRQFALGRRAVRRAGVVRP